MLIQLANRFVIAPTQYPRRLVVELEVGEGFGVDSHPECGVFSGRHDGFNHPEEMNQRIPENPVDDVAPWTRRYEILAPNRSQPSRCWRYHYVAIGHHCGVYIEYPTPTEIVLEDSAGSWSVSIGQGKGVTVLMPDYSPWTNVSLTGDRAP